MFSARVWIYLAWGLLYDYMATGCFVGGVGSTSLCFTHVRGIRSEPRQSRSLALPCWALRSFHGVLGAADVKWVPV